MSTRRTHSPEFKARVAMKAISGRKTLREIAADHAIAIHPIHASQWEKQLQEGAAICSAKVVRARSMENNRYREAELLQAIAKLSPKASV